MRVRVQWLVTGVCLACFAGCLELRDAPSDDAGATECASCHGDPKRPGDSLLKAAPPRDLWQVDDTRYPGVGAHSIHLYDGKNHTAVACGECHVVPSSVAEPGHADDGRPAEIVFGALAKTDGRMPEYDPERRRCSDTWCHRDADAVWTRPRSSEAACGSCHGLPPPLPHPQATECVRCHADVVDAAGHVKNPALHVNGVVEYSAGECRECHGDAMTAAPPLDTRGNEDRMALGVGAHRAHLSDTGIGRPLACQECHRVPEAVADSDHIDEPPAEVIFQGVAAAFGREPAWDREARSCADTWCHSPGAGPGVSPVWTSTGRLGCGDCHGAPPPLPHPQATQCEHCHADVVSAGFAIVDRDRHVDGTLDVSVDASCSGCHGSENLAPPLDTREGSDTDLASVGAHQTHVLGTNRSRAVPCGECHQVPEEVLSAGHLDSELPAELVFSGLAAHLSVPSYDNGSCRQSYCHGAVFPRNHDSGGSLTAPEWTRVDGSQAKCGSCHGLPPPRPHPNTPHCADCHRNMLPDHQSFRNPELHVNGIAETVLE